MVSMKDVASLCGVSFKTVSNVINRHPNVRAEVRERVLAAIAETGYVPNLQARALVLKKAGPASHLGYRIGCVISEPIRQNSNSYYSMILRGIESEIRHAGHQLKFIEADDELLRDPLRLNYFISPENTDGMISFVAEQSAVFSRLCSRPLVLIGKHDKYDCVTSRKVDGIALVMNHLFQQGHRDIGFAGGADGDRRKAFLAELNRLQLEFRAEWCLGPGYGFAPGRTAAHALTKLPGLPTAMVCANDLTAIGMIHGLLEQEVPVPERVSVTGYDDIPEGQLIYPPLTTVNVNAEGAGRMAVRALLERIRNPEQEVCSRSLPVSLVVRGSVRTLPVR